MLWFAPCCLRWHHGFRHHGGRVFFGSGIFIDPFPYYPYPYDYPYAYPPVVVEPPPVVAQEPIQREVVPDREVRALRGWADHPVAVGMDPSARGYAAPAHAVA